MPLKSRQAELRQKHGELNPAPTRGASRQDLATAVDL
jgi:hypothetical protein